MALDRKAKTARRKQLRADLKLLKRELRSRIKQVSLVEKEYAQLKKMRPGGGRTKGNSFENRVAKLIVSQFGLDDDDCYRTPGSGGHRYAKKKDPGDLVLSRKARKFFPFGVECKCVKEADLYPLWHPERKHKKSWPITSWIKQSIDASAHKKDRHPIVVFKQNKGPILAIMPEIPSIVSRIRRKMQFDYAGEAWYVVLFTDLLRKMYKILVEQGGRQ